MFDLDPQTRGNILMGGGALVAAMVVFRDKLKGVWSNLFPGKDSTDNSIDNMSVHDVVQVLIEDRQAVGDEEGVMLIGTFGKHIYDYEIKEASTDEV